MLSARGIITQAELYAQAWYNGHYYTYPGVLLFGTTGTYSWTDTGLGNAISFQIRLKEADGRWAETVFMNDGSVGYTGSWSNQPVVPVLSVTYNQTSVTAGTPIFASYQITGGAGNYTRCEVNWTVQDENGRYITSTRFYEQAAAGNLTLDAQTVKGTHFLTVNVEDGSGWTFQQEDRNNGIEVTTDGTAAPLDILEEWAVKNGYEHRAR